MRVPKPIACWPETAAALGLVKVERRGAQVYALPGPSEAEATGEERLRSVLRELPYELRDSGTILVVKTLPGSAHPIAAALDRNESRGVHFRGDFPQMDNAHWQRHITFQVS